MDLNSINQIAQQLINALREQTEANINLLGMQRRNRHEDILNRSASRGTLYSSGGGAQQVRFDAQSWLPAVTEARGRQQQQELNIRGDLLDVQRKIQSQKRAAAELNSITFDHLLD